MKRMRFKFLVSDSLLLCVENQEWFDPDLSLEQFLKKQWGLVPCAPQSFPERESGFYYIREGKGLYTVYAYLRGQWWLNERRTHGEFEPQHTFSEREVRTLVQMVRMGRKKWLRPEVLQMLYEYRHQQELREITRDTRKHMERFLKKEGLTA